MDTDLFIPIQKSSNPEELLAKREKDVQQSIDSLITKKTPEGAIYNRAGRGGGSFSYVQAWWLIDQLNNLFDYDWDWTIDDQGIGTGHVWVRGTLTIRKRSESGRLREIKKSAFGGIDIKFYASGNVNAGKSIDMGDDLKGAATDAFKKAASYLGLAADIYGKHEQQEAEDVNQLDKATAEAIVRRYKEAGFNEETFKSWVENEDQKDVNPDLVSFEGMNKAQAVKILSKLIKQAVSNQKEKDAIKVS